MVKAPLQNKGKLHALAQSYLEVDACELQASLPDALSNACDRATMICKCIMCLISPTPGASGSKPVDVNGVLGYKGQNSVLVLLKDELKRKDWTKLWDEVLAKYSGSQQLLPEVQRVMNGLKEQPINPDVLAEVCGKIAAWKKACREGMLDELEQLLGRALHASGKEMLENDGKGATMHLLELIQKGLGLFLDKDSFDLCSRLSKLQTKVGADLWLSDLLNILKKNYPETCDDSAGVSDEGGEKLNELVTILQMKLGVSGVLNPAAKAHLQSALFWHFRDLYLFQREAW